MFDVGQKVICVRKDPWVCDSVPGLSRGPKFGEECTVIDFDLAGTPILCPVTNRVGRTGEDSVDLQEYPGDMYGARWFRPKEPNIEALRSLITKLSAKQPEKV